MRYKSKHRLYIWGSIGVAGAFILATVIPITLNSISKNHLSFTFDYRTSFSGDSKYAKYYGKAPSELGATDITADQFNQFLVNNNNDLDMQFAEIAYGVRTYLYSFFDTTTFDWSAKLYNYHHRINDGEFQCRYWLEINFNYYNRHPWHSYASKYRILINEYRPLTPVIGGDAYNVHFDLFYHFTPLFNNWGIIQLNENMLFHSLVFANAKFVESANE